MVKLYMFFIAFLFSLPASAQKDIDIESWSKSSAQTLLRSNVLVVAPLIQGSYPRIRKLVKSEFISMLGLKQLPLANTAAFFYVNNLKPNSTVEAAKILNVDYAFETGNKGTKITHTASGKVVEVPPTKSTKVFNSYLRKSFGYDGYVVDIRDELLLVKFAHPASDIGSQAVVLDSEEPFITKDVEVKGTFLIEMIEKSGDFGIFKVVIGDGNKKIPAFAKVQFSAQ